MMSPPSPPPSVPNVPALRGVPRPNTANKLPALAGAATVIAFLISSCARIDSIGPRGDGRVDIAGIGDSSDPGDEYGSGDSFAPGDSIEPPDITPPIVSIGSPNGGADFTTSEGTHALTGSCSVDTAVLTIAPGDLVDADCSDGTWQAASQTLVEGGNIFTVTAQDASGNSAQASQTLTFDPPPSISITAPVSASGATLFESPTTVAGTCSIDAISVTSNLGTVVDDDCSDGTWSLAPYVMDYPPRLHRFTVTVADAFGTLANASVEITFAYVRINNGAGSVWARESPLILNGRCSTEVVTLFVDRGALIGSDCSDGTFSVSVPFAAGEGTYTVTATGTDSSGLFEQVAIDVFYDTTPPAPVTFTGTDPSSPNSNCFPSILGDSEARTLVDLFSDASCTQALVRLSTNWFTGTAWTGGIRIPTRPGSVTTIYGQATDRAGNQSACSPTSVTYVNSRPSAFPVCDVNVEQDMSFAEFQATLDAAEADRAVHIDDSVIAVCLADGIHVSTTSLATGGRLEIPGDNFYLLAPIGNAVMHNSRLDDTPSVAAARGVLAVQGREDFSMANLTLQAEGEGGSGLYAIDSSIASLKGLQVLANTTDGRAVFFTGEDLDTVWLGEMTTSTLRGSTAMHARSSRMRAIENILFEYYRREGLHLGNGDSILGELRDSIISSEQATDGGFGLYLWTANRNASVQSMSGVTVRRGASAIGSSGSAVWLRHYPGDGTYVSTPNIVGNSFCHTGVGDWAVLLQDLAGPTVAYDPSRNDSTNGTRSFPWGDASDAAANPGYNLQAQWGGVCP